MSRIISINCIVLLVLLSFTKADETTLRFTLRDEKGDAIVLNWEQTEQFLANEHMPLWLARHTEDIDTVDVVNLPNYIATNLGKFVFYRDIQKSSAVVYFQQSNVFFGNIGEKYIINALPLTELKREHSLRGSRYVLESDHTKIIQVCQRINSRLTPNYQREISKTPDNEPLVLYPEILILVTNEMFTHAQRLSPVDPLAFLTAQYFVYVNTISMLLDKLSTNAVKIHINMAGIIVEDEIDAFPFTRPRIADDDNFSIDIKDTLLYSAPRYLRRAGFSDDSFDFFFISTSYQLRNPIQDSGYITPQFHMYEMRSSPRLTEQPRFLGFIELFETKYVSSIYTARKITSLMGINTKTQTPRIVWRPKNVRDLLVYASQNRNHCFLLNLPRSLQPFGHPITTLSPAEQCICYGHSPAITDRNMVGPGGCDQMLRCRDRSFPTDINRIPLPIDGTPCDTDKVCWNKQCQSL